MFNLVLWSFAISLLPVALSLTWSLISGAGDLVGRGLSWAVGQAEQRMSLGRLDFNPPSGLVSVASTTLSPAAAGRCMASNRRRSCSH
jgi:hypothetical protein